MPELALTRSLLCSMALLAAGALLRCGDEGGSAEPSTDYPQLSPAVPAAPAPELSSPSRALRGVGSPAIRLPPIDMPGRALPPVEPEPSDADAGVSLSLRPTSGH
ncbi:MAG: hypothetical protein RL033_4751 [Pseudomonadota bacterium]|jgi:hypothetical protein